MNVFSNQELQHFKRTICNELNHLVEKWNTSTTLASNINLSPELMYSLRFYLKNCN